MSRFILVASLGLLSLAVPASASEFIGGAYAHNVNLPTSLGSQESGAVDLLFGWRGDRLQKLSAIGSPSLHGYVIVNGAHRTDFATAGVSWRLGKGPVYFRPGIGLAIHDGKLREKPNRLGLGSTVLFAPEFAIGLRLNGRTAVEATWLHFSHAQLFSKQNPGIDLVGARVSFAP